MKIRIFILVIFLYTIYCSHVAVAQTTIPGGTLASAHWILSGSPYKITGHIIVANGDSLVIDPGVVVEFQGKYKLFCNGRILANGTSAQPILFTVPLANRTTGWLGIRYDNTPTSNGQSIFQYCTIEYGKADVTGDDMGGAFYFNNYSNCTISNCTLRNNYADRGGCIYGMSSSPTLKHCTFSNNSSDQGGLCVDLYYSASVIDSCYFTNAGITTGASTLKITNCTFYKCTSQGGISAFADHNTGSGYLEISHNVFDSCTQVNGGGGGAVLLFNEKAKIGHNIFKNNISHQGGGAISCYTQASYANTNTTIISNNLFYHNASRINPLALASLGGGAIHFSNCSGKVINNTIVNNISDTLGGAIFCENGSSPSFYNNIIFDNRSGGGSIDNIFILDNTSDPNFYNNNLQGGYSAINTNGTPLVGANVNNINATPNFTSPSTNVYTLVTGSPCIDAGDTIGIGSLIPATDLAGNFRMTNANIDMGAYESAGTPTTGISPIVSIPVSVMPNPARDYFQLYGLLIRDLKSVQVIDISGRQVANFERITNNHFDISHIASGIFLARVNFRNGGSTIVKVRKD